MTPLEIEILLHYNCRADDWRNGDHSAPILKGTFQRFLDEGLLTRNLHDERCSDGTLKARYASTDRTRAYVRALRSVPLPVQVWIIPTDLVTPA